MAEQRAAATSEGNVDTQASQQTGQQQMRLRLDESKMSTTYSNGFRTNGTPEEMLLDFGMNVVTPAANGQPEMLFQVSNRIVLNYYSAKRLALALGQAVRSHEERFGVLELDVTKRQKKEVTQ